MERVSTHICLLSRIQGRVGGVGVSVSVSHDGDFGTWAEPHSNRGGGAGLLLQSFLDQRPGGGTSTEFETYSWSSTHRRCSLDGPHDAWWATRPPWSESLCYVTRINGGFGAGESAEIIRERIGGVDYWVLRIHQGTSSAGSEYRRTLHCAQSD